jgi:hypothetical protein
MAAVRRKDRRQKTGSAKYEDAVADVYVASKERHVKNLFRGSELAVFRVAVSYDIPRSNMSWDDDFPNPVFLLRLQVTGERGSGARKTGMARYNAVRPRK